MMNNQFQLTIEPQVLNWSSTYGDHTTHYTQYRSTAPVYARWTFADGVEISVREQPEHKTTYRAGSRDCDRETIRTDKKARVYVSGGQAFNLAEDLTNRCRRPHNAWRAPVVEALARIGLHPTKLVWSQKAGCSMCPCSPGFILEGSPEARRFNIWVTLPDAPTVDESKPPRELALAL